MTVTIQLPDEQAAAIEQQAALEGLTIDSWLQRLAATQVGVVTETALEHTLDERPIWQIVSDIMSKVPDEVFKKLPTDGASQHDHYIYGWPKRDH